MSELKRSIGTPLGEAEEDEMMENRIREVLEYDVEWDLVKKDSTCSDRFIIKSEGKFFTFIPETDYDPEPTPFKVSDWFKNPSGFPGPMCFGTETLEEAELLYRRDKRQAYKNEAKKREKEKKEAARLEEEKREEEKREAKKREAEQHKRILARVENVRGYTLTEGNMKIIKTDDDCMDRFIIESQGKYFTFTKNSLHFISDSLKEAELFYKMDQKSLIMKGC